MITELILEQTPKTPQIDFNQLTGNLILSGKSIPENAAKIYEPLFNWISEYTRKPNPTTNLRLNLEYYNTATSIWLTRIIKALIRIDKPDYTLFLHLYIPVEDFDELEDFEDIKDTFIPISQVEQGVIPCIGIKLYGTGEKGEIIRDTLIFIENEQVSSGKTSVA
jgi:hypothetical protein